jgi:hypothetical protein
MEERREICKKHEEQMAVIAQDLHEIKKLLLGNGVAGVAEMSRRAFETCTACSKAKSGLWDWAFRAVITIMIGFVAVRIGIK